MSISEEMRARIRRLFYAEHWKIGTIAAQLDLHHETVENAVGQSLFFNKCYRPIRTALDPYKALLVATLEEFPRLRATRLFDMIQPRGFTGTVFQVRRFVKKIRIQSRHKAYFRLTVLPGEQGQVDWGCFGTLRIGRATRKLSCFVLRLSWSRAIYAEFGLDQTLESFLRGHINAFDRLGGVPRTLLYDNLKTAVLERQGDLIRFHPRLLEFAGHYHFKPIPCAPAAGNEKGRVESAIKYIRYSFFEARTFTSIEDLNTQLRDWLEARAFARPVPNDPEERIVRVALTEEQMRLLPRPEHPFPTDLVRPIASGKTPYIRFDKNDYSIPHTLVRKTLTLAASESIVRILDGDVEVARHNRSYDKGRQVEVRAHLDGLAAEKRRAAHLRGRNRLTAECDDAHDFLADIARVGGPLGATTARLLKLLDRFGANAVNTAILDAHQRRALSAHSVAHILDQRHRLTGAAPPLESALSEDVRAKDVVIVPHELSDYDALGRADKPSYDTELGGPQ